LWAAVPITLAIFAMAVFVGCSGSSNSGIPQDDSPASGQRSTPSLTSATGALLFAGLASPFLELAEGVSDLIGLVIIFVGIRIAWKMTGAPRLDILGPFQGNAPPSPAPNI